MSRSRHVRVKTPAVEVRLATEQGRLMNISATGALLHTNTSALVGRTRPLTLKVADQPVPVNVRIVRVEFLPPAVAQAANSPNPGKTYGVAVTFVAELTGPALQAVADLCGPAFTEQESGAG